MENAGFSMVHGRIRAALLALIACCLLAAAWVRPAAAQSVSWTKTIYGQIPTTFAPGGFPNDLTSLIPHHKHAVGMDAAGNVFATGGVWYIHSPEQDFTCKTYKYAAVNGAVLWERNYVHPGARRICRLVVDAAGNVYLGSDAQGEFKVIKYSGATGAVLWEAATTGGGYNPEWSLEAQIESMTLDGSGNVLATGSWFNGSVHQLRTAKFSASGAVVWDKLRGAGLSTAAASRSMRRATRWCRAGPRPASGTRLPASRSNMPLRMAPFFGRN